MRRSLRNIINSSLYYNKSESLIPATSGLSIGSLNNKYNELYTNTVSINNQGILLGKNFMQIRTNGLQQFVNGYKYLEHR